MPTGGIFRRRLERDERISLAEQLRGEVELAVLRGELGNGQALPSVRELAASLGVSQGTVVRAYQQLEREGLIVARPRRGFFTAAVNDEVTRSFEREVARLVDDAIRAAASAGIDSAQFLQIVATRVRARRVGRRRVVVTGYAEAALAERAALLRASVKDLDVEVVSVSYDELANSGAAAFAGAECYVIPVLEEREAKALLQPPRDRVVPMTRSLREDVRRFIREQPADTRIGIIAVNEEYAGRLLAAVRHMHPLRRGSVTAVASDRTAVKEVISRADVLVVGPRARLALADLEPLPRPNVNLIYLPDEATVRRLRARLTRRHAPSTVDPGALRSGLLD